MPLLSVGTNSEANFETVRQFYKRQSALRIEALRKITSLNFEIYKILVPEVHCRNLVRVGAVGDGGKWICNPWSLPKKNCSIYSLGLNNEISFDVEIQQFTEQKCKLYGYDMSQQHLETVIKYKAINGKLHKIMISNGTNKTRAESTVEDLFRSNGDTYAEVLKMDVEGIEMTQLPLFLEKIKVCQILLEAHGSPLLVRKLISSIAVQGYLLYYFELNGNLASEFSFINQDCMERYGAEVMDRYLDQTFVQVCNSTNGLGPCQVDSDCAGKDLICERSVSNDPVCCPYFWGPQ